MSGSCLQKAGFCTAVEGQARTSIDLLTPAYMVSAAVVSYMSKALEAPHARSNAELLSKWCVCGHDLQHITGFWFQYLQLRMQAVWRFIQFDGSRQL